jgi:hypothetical protein
MLSQVNTLWKLLSEEFEEFLVDFLSSSAPVKARIGSSSNEHFPLRGYLSFMGISSGDEVAITVDVTVNDGFLRIETDVVSDDGGVLLVGPRLEQKILGKLEANNGFKQYALDVRNFLAKERSIILSKVIGLA